MASIYEQIRTKIEENGGVRGDIGSFNHKGGTPIKIKYDVDDNPEVHHAIPYVTGIGQDKEDQKVKMLVAYKYGYDQGAHAGTGFRCYKVESILDVSGAPNPVPDELDPPPHLKFKKQNCVTDW